VSGRIVGRAEGGMADTIRRRLSAPDPYLDSALEPALIRARRAWFRRRFRSAYAAEASDCDTILRALARDMGLPIEMLHRACNGASHGEAWATLEVLSPRLTSQRVAVVALPDEMATAERLRAVLRAASSVTDVAAMNALAPSWSDDLIPSQRRSAPRRRMSPHGRVR
jgi:hypothetical protein